MIYTITLNPSLDYVISVDSFQPGRTNRTAAEAILPGGKGLNVSYVLNQLGIENIAFGYVAGFTGEEIVRLAQKRGMQTDFVTVSEGVSRINIKLTVPEGTEINGQGPVISDEEIEVLMAKIDGMTKADTVILSGSAPASLTRDIYGRIVARLQSRGVRWIGDVSGEALRKLAEYKPFLLKPNHFELGQAFGVECKTIKDVIPYGKKLRKAGAENVLISLAGAGAVLLAADGAVYRADAPVGTVLNPTGAGDSMVAGFVAGMMQSGDYYHAFQMAVAAGSACAFSADLPTKDEIAEVYGNIRIESV